MAATPKGYDNLMADVHKRGAYAVLQDLARQAEASGKKVSLPSGGTFDGAIFANYSPGNMGAGLLIDKLAPYIPLIAAQLAPKTGGRSKATPTAAPVTRERAHGAFDALLSGLDQRIAPTVQLPSEVPLKDFVQLASTPEKRESLSPGITGPDGYKNITTAPDGRVMVKLANTQPDWHDQNLQAYTDHLQAQPPPAPDVNAPPKVPMIPIGELVRSYGADVVNTMYPGIFEKNGYQPYLQKFGTHETGQLQVPDYRVLTQPPPGAPAPTAPTQPSPADASIPLPPSPFGAG